MSYRMAIEKYTFENKKCECIACPANNKGTPTLKDNSSAICRKLKIVPKINWCKYEPDA